MSKNTTNVPVYQQLIDGLKPHLEKLQLRVEDKSGWIQIVNDANGHRIDLKKEVTKIPLCDTTMDCELGLPTKALDKPNGRVAQIVVLGDASSAYKRLKALVELLATADTIRPKAKGVSVKNIPQIVLVSDEEPSEKETWDDVQGVPVGDVEPDDVVAAGVGDAF